MLRSSAEISRAPTVTVTPYSVTYDGQPHTAKLYAQMLKNAGVDQVVTVHNHKPKVLADIYAAGEEPIPGVTLDTLASAIRDGSGRPLHLVRTLEEMVPTLLGIVRAGDAVITLGAGSIGTVPRRLVSALEGRGGGR